MKIKLFLNVLNIKIKINKLIKKYKIIKSTKI